ncbi:MAG: nuclear transport factor 2 family protein [Terracidiphilus sp.]
MQMRRLTALGLLLVPMFGVCAPIPSNSQSAQTGQAPHGSAPKGHKHEVRHEIDRLEEKWRNAVLKGDTAAMESLLADDYMAITPSGTLQTKQEAMENLRSGKVHFTSLEISDRKVRFYGTTALVTSVATIEGTNPEGSISGSFRYTRVYVRNPQGAWKVVSFEANRIREPGDHGNDHSR